MEAFDCLGAEQIRYIATVLCCFVCKLESFLEWVTVFDGSAELVEREFGSAILAFDYLSPAVQGVDPDYLNC